MNPMSHTHELSGKNLPARLERLLSILANTAVIAGIIFAFFQIIQTNQAEKRRIAIEAIRQVRTNEFLKANDELKTAYATRHIGDEQTLLDNLNYVMNVYDNIAIMYINNLADRCVVKNSIYSGAKEFAPVLGFLKSPERYRNNFDMFIEHMERKDCGDQP